MSPPLGPEGASTRNAEELRVVGSLETNTASGIHTGRQGRYVPRACEECRSRHLKCNGVQAGCDRCTADSRMCVYSLVPDRRRTAANADATEKIQLSQTRLAKLLQDCAQALSENEQLKNDLRQPASGPSALGNVESQRHMFTGQSAITPSELSSHYYETSSSWMDPTTSQTVSQTMSAASYEDSSYQFGIGDSFDLSIASENVMSFSSNFGLASRGDDASETTESFSRSG